ncbi:hypothetical protein [Saccharothrix australiensis]|uniref:Uncharacterized protein n=1 Tax=Saccharothrix australiensis TaxID=2072 RepID=A0A495W1X7_9PSEU|nr:hypothetical protein [Saccharothrix australiensis]RKT55027.1 hypothetical protein C8E97_3683 [Saccharothrix australiensis]
MRTHNRLAVAVVLIASVVGSATAVAAPVLAAPTSAVAGDGSHDVAPAGVFEGLWEVAQSNGDRFRLFVGAADGGGSFQGLADSANGSGDVSGRLTGHDVVFTIRWSYGHSGRYSGRLGSDGQWSGETIDLNDPSSHATWWAHRV